MSTNLHTLLELSLPLNLELRLTLPLEKAKAACELANTVWKAWERGYIFIVVYAVCSVQ